MAAPSRKHLLQKKSPLALMRQRAEERLISEALSTPQHARRMAVTMAMSVVNNNHEVTE